MPRPLKLTVDYFPHYVHSKTTLFTIEARYGNDGYALWFKLLETLCQSENYSFDFANTAKRIWFITRCHLDEGKAIEILDLLAELDAISKEKWEERIIYVPNLIKNLNPILSRRVSYTDNPLMGINVDNNPSDVSNKPIERDYGDIKKEKELKELKELNKINDIGQMTDFLSFKEKLVNANNGQKVGILTVAFKAWHSKAPQDDVKTCGGRFASMLKITTDPVFILSKIWDTADKEIVGSHLNYIQGALKGNKQNGIKENPANQSGGVFAKLAEKH